MLLIVTATISLYALGLEMLSKILTLNQKMWYVTSLAGYNYYYSLLYALAAGSEPKFHRIGVSTL